MIKKRGDCSYSSPLKYQSLQCHTISLKFIYSEKTTKFCEVSTVDLTGTTYIGQIYGGDFAKICVLLRIYELYVVQNTCSSFKRDDDFLPQGSNLKLSYYRHAKFKDPIQLLR